MSLSKRQSGAGKGVVGSLVMAIVASGLHVVRVDAEQTQWVVRTTSGPSARTHHQIAYDSARGVTVLFGGETTAGRFGDTWEWNGQVWSLRSTSGPSARCFHAMAYDSARSKVVLFGGNDSQGMDRETWEWDGTAWTLRATGGPTARQSHAMAYDATRQRVVMFGGFDGAPDGETWEWDGGNWVLRSTSGPTPRYDHVMSYDSARGRTVLFGGYVDHTVVFGDTWEWDGSGWALRATMGPPARADHGMAYDAERARLVLFGGVYADGAWQWHCLADTWEWNGTAWAACAVAGPSAREPHSLTYDGVRCATVLFGGYDYDGMPRYYADTWEYGSVPSALVTSAVAQQRPDATKVVDICYELDVRQGESADVSIRFSNDGGASWSIVPAAVSGDIGPGILEGQKRIVWNPAVDFPGGGGTNFRARVTAGSSWADSNVFSIVTAGPGDLMGTVRDQVTGNPIAGATVAASGQPAVQTGPQGEFGFAGIQAGEVTLTVTASGYCAVVETVWMREFSATNADIIMTPAAGYGICAVRGRYCGPDKRVFYLNGSNLAETFTASINWEGHTPSYVRWITPLGEYQTPCSSGIATRSFNMGTDFGAGGWLEVIAVAGDGAPTAEYLAHFKVIPVPPGIMSGLLYAVPWMNTLQYKTLKLDVDPTRFDDGVEDGIIPDDMPLFGRKAFKFARSFDFSAEVDEKGRAQGITITPYIEPDKYTLLYGQGTKIAGIELGPQVSGYAMWQFCESPDRWVPGGHIEIGVDMKAKVPPTPIILPLPLPVPIYLRGRIELGVAVGLDIQGWAGPGDAILDGSLYLDPFPYAELDVGAGVADVIAIEVYGGGGAKWKLNYPPFPPDPVLEELKIYLAGGVRIVFFIFSQEWPLLEWTWDVYGGRWAFNPGEPQFGLLPRDYLGRRGGYAVFVANDYRGGLRDVVNQETPVQLNVFGQSTPDLAASGDDLLAVWVYDDPARTPTNRTEVVFSKYDAVTQTWSQPVAAADDETADFHPQIAALPNGDALLVWENVREALVEPGAPGDPCIQPCHDECVGDPDPETCESNCRMECKYDELKGKTEIAVARYDHVAGTWGPQAVLTNNANLDRSPRIAVAPNGTALLTWVSNAANEEMGSPTNPNDIHFALYNGVNWSAPALVATGVPSVVKSALAYNGAQAVLLFSGDTDGNTQTPEDRELFGVTYAGGSWGAVQQLTHDPNSPVEDGNPQVAYDSNGDLLLVWYRGGDIVMATNLALSDQRIIVDRGAGASSGAADFRLATGLTGQIGLVWQDASEDQADIWSALYDPTLAVWSKPVRLTADPQVEHALAPVYDASGNLVTIYDKMQTVYQTRTVTVGGEEIVIDNVPVPDQTDLYLLRHIVGGDLSIAAADVVVTPPNPLPGTNATITATVHNSGDVAAQSIQVAFYDGVPGQGGTLIGTMPVIVGPLVGGGEAAASVVWAVPASTAPRTLVVVVDPNMQQEDRDRTNNAGSLRVLFPDLTISEIGVQAAGRQRIFTVRIENIGTLTVSSEDVVLRRDAVNGQALASFVIPGPLVPGAFYDLSWTWENVIPIVGGSVTVFAVVDEANLIEEFDESNNVRSTVLTNPPPSSPGDWNHDGHVDVSDWLAFPACMSGPWDWSNWTTPTQDCLDVFDLDADADVDMVDFAGFQLMFGG